MGVPPKRMVYGENLIKMDDFGVPPFMETPMCFVMYERKWWLK